MIIPLLLGNYKMLAENVATYYTVGVADYTIPTLKHTNPVLNVVLALFLISPGIQDEQTSAF